MKPSFWLRIGVAATCFFFFSLGLQSQDNCKFFDDFSNPVGWTQVGNLVSIQNGVVEYQNGAPDAEQRRVYKNLGVSLNAGDTWSADIDFTPVSVGDYNGPHAGHAIVALTAGPQEPFSNCPDVACSGYPPSQQDGIVCMFGSPGNPSDGNSYFLIKAIEGADGSDYSSTPIVANDLGVTYYVRLERTSSTLVQLSVFSDAAKTIHLPGSPVTLNILASIEGLNTVQHGNIARGGWYRELTGAVDNLCIKWGNVADPVCNFFDNFSNPVGWNQIGNLVSVQNGVVEYQNGAPDAEQRRVYKNIGVSLTAGDTWSADIDFTPVSVGDYNGPHAGHAIVALTAGPQEPFSNCPDVACSGYPPSQQDGIVCMFGSPGNPSDGNSYFLIKAIEGADGSDYSSTPIIANDLGVTYYVRLERTSSTLVQLSVFSDAAKTIHLPGSPVTLNILASIEGLNTVQHGNIARGGWYRELTGTVDNLCIKWRLSESCPPDRTLSAVVGNVININTGVDENLNLLPFGVTDPRWTVVGNTLPPMQTVDRWNFTPVMSQWLEQSSGASNYQVRFNFCTEACGDYRLNFRMLADNGACVYLDGMPVPSSWWLGNVPIPDCNFNPGDQSPFIPTAGYQIDHTLSLLSGMHTLEIDVVNFSQSLTGIDILGGIEVVAVNNCPCQPDRTIGLAVGTKININTGVDEQLNVLPFGVLDPRWSIQSNTLPPMQTIDRWNFSPVASQWISFENNQGSEETNYQVQFNFCVRKCGNYRLNFRMLADNGACVYLDGVPVPSSWWINGNSIPDCNFNPGDQSPFIPTAGYQIDYETFMYAGEHVLLIDVTNFSGSLTSINIQGEIEALELLGCSTGTQQTIDPVAEYKIFPNPAQDQITLQWSDSAPGLVRILDVAGRNLRSIQTPEGSTGELQISLDGLMQGAYFLLWQDHNGRMVSRRFVKI